MLKNETINSRVSTSEFVHVESYGELSKGGLLVVIL